MRQICDGPIAFFLELRTTSCDTQILVQMLIDFGKLVRSTIHNVLMVLV